MIIHVVSASDVELRDPDNFKAFKITVDSAALTPAEIAQAIAPIGTIEPDGRTVWVSQAALKNWKGTPQPAEWVASFDKMIESVKKYGWVNEADATVRGHIEPAAG
jgi:hypothetical protein